MTAVRLPELGDGVKNFLTPISPTLAIDIDIGVDVSCSDS